MSVKNIKFLSIVFFLFVSIGFGQNSRKKLEQRRLKLQREIEQINTDLSRTKKTESNALIELNKFNRKIEIRQELIRNLRREINGITRQIKKNNQEIGSLTSELITLKKDYAHMIRQSYNSRSRVNKLYFLFSSDGFYQAFKRMQYLKQYSLFRKKQGEEIQLKKEKLEQLKTDLVTDKKEKDKFYQDYQAEQNIIKKEKIKQQKIVNSIKRKEAFYVSKIRAKQREQAKIDKMIEELIRKAIAKSNKRVRKSSRKTSKFFLTPEGKKLASAFSSNRGMLPWPVKKAYISRKFGVQRHEIFKNVKVNNSGIYLSTEPKSSVRAVFKGKILQIQVIPGGNSTVYIKHGDYLTIYGNLKKVYVKPGETVKTKQKIGMVATDNITHKTELKFRVYKNMTKLNPEKWLFRK